MKKIIFILFAVVSWQHALAQQQIYYNGLNYNITSPTTVEVGDNPGATGAVLIPSQIFHYISNYTVTSISNHAFQGCQQLISVSIPNSVTSIGQGAFFGSSITSVSIPSSVTNINNEVFFNCPFLTTVSLPNTLISIGERAFEACASLYSITIPNTVTSIGDYAFENSGLTSITIPNLVTRIEYYSFSRCTNLTSVTIGNSVTVIDAAAFSDCSSLTSVTIPISVTTIWYGAFENCSSLTSVTIPPTVTTIGDRAFAYCTNLTSVICSASYPAPINANVFEGVSQSSWQLLVPQGYVVIYNYYAVWQNFAPIQPLNDTFTYNGIKYIVTSLTTVAVGNNEDSSGNIIIPASVTDGFRNYTVTSIGNGAFRNSGRLASITIPDSVTSIGDNAFSNSIGLSAMPIGNSVTSIGANAFDSCWGLRTASIPDSVTSIGPGAFNNCMLLTTVTIGNSVTSIGDYAFSNCHELSSLTIGNSVTSIGASAFSGCPLLETVAIPNSVTSIGANAFAASGLLSVTIPNSVTSIGENAFSNIPYLSSVTIGNSVTRIAPGTFTFCSNLSSVTIGNSVTSIGSSAFRGCIELLSVSIPNSVTSIGVSAFADSGLTSITIPNSVTSIGALAFARATALVSVTIPNSVTSIGAYAFDSCYSLNYLKCRIITPLSINATVFEQVNQAACSLIVPAASLAGYQSAAVWQNFNPITCETTFNTTTISACGSYTWNGIVYTTSGLKTGTTTNCVTEQLNLTITPSSDNITIVTACDSYSWNGTIYTTSGIKIGTTTNCITEKLNLTITPSTTYTTTISACGSYIWAVTGQTYTASGTYSSVTGCVTKNLVLTITPASTTSTTASACVSYTWAVTGQTYTTSGTYSSVTGCVTKNLVLTITPASTTSTTASACGSYTWAENGQTYTTSGTYSSVTGCVTKNLVLTITPASTSTSTAAACASYTWAVNGQTYTTSGTYSSVTGCVTKNLVLTITPASTASTTAAACGSYTWAENGQTYTTSGTYSSVTGCVTKNLVLTITPVSTSTTTASACASYTWAVNGQTYTTSGTYSSVTGCVTKNLVLTIIPISGTSTIISACGSYTWAENGQTYMTSGTYSSVTSCVTKNLVLTITPASTATTTASACESYTWNGATYTATGLYIGATANCVTQKLDLTITPSSNHTTAVAACGSYTWADTRQTYTVGGTYTGATVNCVTEVLQLTINVPPSIPDQSAQVPDQITPEGNAFSGFPTQYQTFTAGFSGELQKISIYLGNPFGNISASTLTVTVYEGLGTSGAPLGSATYTYPAQWGFQYTDFNFSGISVVQGQQYTFEVRTPPSRIYAFLQVLINNEYTGGSVSFNPGYDLVFKTYVVFSNQTFCAGATVANLMANGTNVKWYSAATGGIQIASNELLVTGRYYVSQSNDLCESERAPVAVLIRPTTAITSQPVPNFICATVGSTSTFSVVSNAINPSYTWQYRVVTTANANPTWITITSANAAVYANFNTATLTVIKTATLPAIGTQYRVLVSGNCGVAASNSASLTIISTVKAGTISSNTSVCIGSEITLALGGYAGTSFQWQSAATATGVFANIPGATGTSYTIVGATATMDKSYRVIVTNSCNATTATTVAKTITVSPISVAGIVSGGGIVCSGSTGTLKVARNTGTIQWQSSTNGTDFVDVPSVVGTAGVTYVAGSATGTAAVYIATNISGATYFRAKITSGVCSVAYSNAVQFTLGTSASAGTLTAADATVCSGTGTTLTITGSVGTIKWLKSTNWTAASPIWTAVTTTTTATLSTGTLTAATAFKAEVTIGSCSTITSEVVPVLVYVAPLSKTITATVTSPTGATALLAICSATSKVLTIGAGYNGTIQWQRSTTSATLGFVDIADATGKSYTITNPTVGVNYFRARFTNSCGVSVFGTAFTVYYKDCAVAKTIAAAHIKNSEFKVIAYPNPYTENFNLSLTTSSGDTVGISIYDMIGKLIDKREVSPNEAAGLEVGNNYPSGVYNVIVTQGENKKTVRVVKR